MTETSSDGSRHHDDAHAPVPWRSLAAAITAISVAGMGFGHSMPLFSTLLKTYGASDTIIGLNSGVAAIAAVLATPFFPRLIHRVGQKPFLLACLALMVLAYGALFLAGDRILLWYPLRFVLGAAASGLFVASEIWITSISPDHLRGRIIGIYSTFLALGFALGPWLIDLFGYEGFLPFLVGMTIFAAASIPILTATPPEGAEEKSSASGFFSLLPKAPATFLSASMFAGIESSVLVFLPILALDNGWGAEMGARAISVYGFGILAFQYVIGRASDQIGHRRALLLCALTSAAGAFMFAASDSMISTLFVVLFFWGGFLAGLYTVGLTLIGEGFSETERTASNTGYVFMYGIGAILGPVIAGISRDLAGSTGLNLFLIISLSAYAVLVVTRMKSKYL